MCFDSTARDCEVFFILNLARLNYIRRFGNHSARAIAVQLPGQIHLSSPTRQ